MCQDKIQVTIITTTYNRSALLPRLYHSLLKQTYQSFQWLIIDDGSTDDTEQVISSFNEHEFLLDYKKKINGGKHTALNYSLPYIKGEICCIVDSDDWLVDDAVETIINYWKKYSQYKNIKCMTFQKSNGQNKPLADFPDSPVISNHIQFRINSKRDGDCCEVFCKELLKEFPFPEFNGEKFMGEGYLWNNAGFKYDTVYIKKVIYICEYLEGGLTRSGRKLRIQCPHGGMANSNSFFGYGTGRKVNNKTLIKETWLFICYGKFAGLSYKEIRDKCKRPDLVRKNYIFGYLLYRYWRYKYKQ